jgi:SAM-dependent methyltransferase
MSGDRDKHPYLGTHLSPQEYYKRRAHAYHNPHADGIAEILGRLAPHLHGRVLDLGCGDGLATKLLGDADRHREADRGLTFVGADNAPAMVKRYQKETGFPGVVAGFTDALPAADSVVSSYAMHLAAPAEVPMMWYRLWETGADTVLVITPFKERPAAPEHYFERTETVSGPYGPDQKTLYGMIYRRLP